MGDANGFMFLRISKSDALSTILRKPSLWSQVVIYMALSLMLSWKALILARVGLFVVVSISGMFSGLAGRSAKMSDVFMGFW